ncbi:hypothetical protein [Halococcus hamelinensis]|uniref:hypothetical protein n=2 Tax=Halococcus hamelinensis TaxID=332168 RepID=UPI00126732F9|nr:hypothetical protein [Halococcus hamelinensis]
MGNSTPNLDAELSDFLERWRESATERNREYSLNPEQINEEQIPELIENVERLSESFSPGSFGIDIDGGEDQYNVDWDVSLDIIQSDLVSGSEYNISDLYDDDQVEDAIRSISNDRLRSVDDLIDVLQLLIPREDIDLSVDFGIEKRGIVEKLEEEYGFEDTSVYFYFSFNFFEEDLSNVSPENFKREYLSEEDRLVFVIYDFDSIAYNGDFAITGLSSIDQISEWPRSRRAAWKNLMDSVARQSLIENISDVYLPPSFFKFDPQSTGEEAEQIETLFKRHAVLFSMLSITSSAQQDGTMWGLQISGKQLIEGGIQVFSEEVAVRNADGSDETFRIEQLDIENFRSLFEWTYIEGSEPETRMPIVRNVATLFAQNLSDVVANISEIHGSTKSNYQYYVEQTTDDFFEFRQELIDSVFETNSRFSDLRSQLIDGLSRDMFRTIAFVIALGATIYYRLPASVDSTTAFTFLLSLVSVYGLVVLRRVRGIHEQLDRLVNDRMSSVDFYSKFFDESEREDLQLERGVEGSPLQRFFDFLGWTRGEFAFEYTLAYDLFIYYLLVAAILVGTALGLIDLHICNLVDWFPT